MHPKRLRFFFVGGGEGFVCLSLGIEGVNELAITYMPLENES